MFSLRFPGPEIESTRGTKCTNLTNDCRLAALARSWNIGPENLRDIIHPNYPSQVHFVSHIKPIRYNKRNRVCSTGFRPAQT